MYLFERHSDTWWEGREKERNVSFILWLSPQMGTVAGTRLSRSQEPRTPCACPTQMARA